MNKILTLEDLVTFCSTQNLTYFNAREEGKQIVVSVPSSFSFDRDEEYQSMLFCPIKAFHIGRNRNGSSVTKDAAEKAIKNMAYRPVLANFTGEGDSEDFSSHDMLFDEEKDEFVYLEKQVGCFTSKDPYIKYDEENDRDFVFAEVAIPREYTHAAEIIERKGGTDCSVELAVNEMSYSAKDKLLELTDIEVLAVTLLGDHVEPGMAGAHVSLEDFSLKDGFEVNEDLVKRVADLEEKLASFNKGSNSTSFEEGGNGTLDKEQFEELTVETEEAKEVASEEDVVDKEIEVESVEEIEESIIETEEAEEEVEEEIKEEFSEEEPEVKDSFALRIRDREYSFDISLDEVIYSLCVLVNDMYAEQDNTYYSVKVYDDYVVMIDWWNGVSYKQEYKEEDGNYSLVGDRIQVYTQYLTQEEIDSLAELRSNYASVVDELNSYKEKELHAARESVFEDESYASYLDSQEFKSLKDSMDKYSVEELKEKAELAFAKCVKSAGLFENKKDAAKRVFAIGKSVDDKKTEMYPGLF